MSQQENTFSQCFQKKKKGGSGYRKYANNFGICKHVLCWVILHPNLSSTVLKEEMQEEMRMYGADFHVRGNANTLSFGKFISRLGHALKRIIKMLVWEHWKISKF